MAKKDTLLIKMESTAGTGFFKVKKRNPKKQPEKLEMKYFDPKVQKRVVFKEKKLK
jgi:large subunit ribosomal protein L33